MLPPIRHRNSLLSDFFLYNNQTKKSHVMSATVPTQRRPIKISTNSSNDPSSISNSPRRFDTESPPSPTSLGSNPSKNSMSNRGHHHHYSRTNPLNVYKAGQERKGASFKIIVFLAATTFYTAFLYSGAGLKMHLSKLSLGTCFE